jgi:hypothetical protein
MVELLGAMAAILILANVWVRRTAHQRIMAPLDFQPPAELDLSDTLTGRRASTPRVAGHAGRSAHVQGEATIHRQVHAGHVV